MLLPSSLSVRLRNWPWRFTFEAWKWGGGGFHFHNLYQTKPSNPPSSTLPSGFASLRELPLKVTLIREEKVTGGRSSRCRATHLHLSRLVPDYMLHWDSIVVNFLLLNKLEPNSYLPGLENSFHGALDHVSVVFETNVIQHVARRQQHGRRVGHVFAHSFRESMARSLPK